MHGNQLRTRKILDDHGGVEVPGDLGTNRRQAIKGSVTVRFEMEQCKWARCRLMSIRLPAGSTVIYNISYPPRVYLDQGHRGHIAVFPLSKY